VYFVFSTSHIVVSDKTEHCTNKVYYSDRHYYWVQKLYLLLLVNYQHLDVMYSTPNE